MRYQLSKLRGHAIGAVDGEIGTIKDVYFDDEWWGVRYFVVETGSWLHGREVLIPVQAVHAGEWKEEAVPVELTREQVRDSPPVDTERPVSRHYEMAHAKHYRNHYYWNGSHSWAAGLFGTVLGSDQPRPDTEGRAIDAAAAEHETAERSHLRSGKEVMGYHVEATDGTLGEVDDFLIDTDEWRIVAMVADTRTWLPGGKVTLPPEAVWDVNWSLSAVQVNMTRDQVKDSPHFG